MVVQRRDGRRWHCEHDDDDDDLSFLQCFNPVDWLRARELAHKNPLPLIPNPNRSHPEQVENEKT